jgi:hypothetical protein
LGPNYSELEREIAEVFMDNLFIREYNLSSVTYELLGNLDQGL